jgi:hypothetical protein
LGSLADIPLIPADVRFTPESGHRLSVIEFPPSGGYAIFTATRRASSRVSHNGSNPQSRDKTQRAHDTQRESDEQAQSILVKK